jgi:hypothetical protein
MTAWRWMVLGAVVLAHAGCGLFSSSDGRDGVGGVGAPCDGPSDCRAGLACVGGSCEPSGTVLEGGQCELTGSCAEGLYCGGRRICVPAGEGHLGDVCGTTGDCQQGLVCSLSGFFLRCSEPGTADLGEACSSDISCLAGLSCLPNPLLDDALQCTSPPPADTDDLPPAPPQWDGAHCPASDGVPRALFRVPRGAPVDDDFFALPFPNDVRRTDGGLDLSGFPTPSTVLSVDVMGRYVAAAEEDLDGFATNVRVLFRFSEPYDFGTVGGGNLQLVNVDPGSPELGREHGIGWVTTSGRFSKYTCDNVLAAGPGPGAPLLPGTTYALVVHDGVIPAVGGTYGRSEDLAALLSGSAPSDATLADHWASYAPLRSWLADEGVDPGTVLNATVFTTQDPERLVPRLRQVVRSAEPPALTDLVVCDEGVASPCDDGTPQRACGAADPSFVEIHGRMALPIFQAGTPPYEEPADGGGIQTDAMGTPLVARTEDVCFALTVPAGTPMPDAGWPLVVHAHGTGGSFRSAITNGIAEDLATGEPAAALLGFDLPQHGARRGDSDRPPEELFFNFANPRAARDNVMQGAADLMAVAYGAQELELLNGASPTGEDLAVDPSRVLLLAHSQGATHASLMLPYEPAYLAAILSGNGGNLTQSLLTKTEPVDIKSLLPIALLDVDANGDLPLGASHPGLALWQAYFEAVDPVNYARRLSRAPIEGDPGRHVFMTYGLGDRFSTEPTMRAYAVAGQLMLVEPVLEPLSGVLTREPPLAGNRSVGGSSWTIGLRQYEPPEGVDGHFVSTETPQARADVLRFLQHAADGLTPPIGEAPEM